MKTMTEEFDYNYVIAGRPGYYQAGYKDIMDLPQVSWHSSHYSGFKTFWEKQAVLWNFAKIPNRIIKVPFARYVFPRLYPHNFSNGKPLCFLFFGNTHKVFRSNYTDYLRKTYPGVRLVLFLQDLISRHYSFDLDEARSKFDLIISYDRGEAQREGLLFHPTPMSRVEINDNPEIPSSDVYFCGHAKSRYHQVHEVFQLCTKAGLKCDFNILGMPVHAGRLNGIRYLSKPISYTENLERMYKSRCILEIMQDGADGHTPRLWESIIYDKHLITNNSAIKDSPFFHSDGNHLLSSLTPEGIKAWIAQPVRYPEELKDSLSPSHLLHFIDQQLSRR